MSNLSQFAPFAGGLKSFQTVYINVAGSAGSGEDLSFRDVTVSSVNTAKTVSSFQGASASSGVVVQQVYSVTADFSVSFGVVTTRMTSSTNLRLGAFMSFTQFTGRWQLAEAN